MSDLNPGDIAGCAWNRVQLAASRLEAANEELDAAEREHRLANEALDDAQAGYRKWAAKGGVTRVNTSANSAREG